MKFNVTIIGSNSAFHAHNRYPTSQILNHNEKLFLIDCGEGTQIRLSKLDVKKSRINHIFISHLHGDHVYGLPGLITSFSHMSRKKALTIYGPIGVQEFLGTILRLSQAKLTFPVHIVEQDHLDKKVIFENTVLAVHSFPMKHRIDTFGYLFEEKPLIPNVKKEAIRQYQLTTEQIVALKRNETVQLANGQKLTAEQATTTPRPARSYAYCSDTVYDEELVDHIDGTSVLYHETTFMDGLEDLAVYSKHATTTQAATIAKKANVGLLITGHYSSRYKDLQPLLDEVRRTFPNSELGLEGRLIHVDDMEVSDIQLNETLSKDLA